MLIQATLIKFSGSQKKTIMKAKEVLSCMKTFSRRGTREGNGEMHVSKYIENMYELSDNNL